MKKILLLGGSAQQVVAIETAKRLGYKTILCDYLPDNPGQYHADTFHQVSTTDKAAVLSVALQEQVDAVLAYASDPAAPTAAYVAEKMGLPGNPTESVEILCNKDRFRAFLAENGFSTPRSGAFTDLNTAKNELRRFDLPIIIKPVDSSGSKGVTVLHSYDQAQQALEFAFSFSRKHRIIAEEYIEKKHPYLIGGDIFIVDGKIKLWGLLNCHRDPQVNPLVPVGKSFPLLLDKCDLLRVKDTLQAIVDKLHIRFGAMNVELIVDSLGRVFPIDIGPRCGGNMIPELLGYIFDVDLVEFAILTAMGEYAALPDDLEGHPYYATHNLHSCRTGLFQDIRFSHELERNIIRKSIYKKPNDPVDFFSNASNALGILFLKFENAQSMTSILSAINDHIEIVISQ